MVQQDGSSNCRKEYCCCTVAGVLAEVVGELAGVVGEFGAVEPEDVSSCYVHEDASW